MVHEGHRGLSSAPAHAASDGSTVMALGQVRPRRKVMTVFGSSEQRDKVHRLADLMAPGCLFVDVASATDAVLTLLAGPVDVVLIDARLAGDLLNALQRHARRSSPQARLAVFGEAGAKGGPQAARVDRVQPWSELRATLTRLLQLAENED
jgi:hypothetical protein